MALPLATTLGGALDLRRSSLGARQRARPIGGGMEAGCPASRAGRSRRTGRGRVSRRGEPASQAGGTRSPGDLAAVAAGHALERRPHHRWAGRCRASDPAARRRWQRTGRTDRLRAVGIG